MIQNRPPGPDTRTPNIIPKTQYDRIPPAHHGIIPPKIPTHVYNRLAGYHTAPIKPTGEPRSRADQLLPQIDVGADRMPNDKPRRHYSSMALLPTCVRQLSVEARQNFHNATHLKRNDEAELDKYSFGEATAV
ncbi:hypothetical protein PtA15_2A280 [Puccinia triticina]|uniref:Uncharacterized protein n=1 Tax=Puccinia triticina TaxID=208348 RepID=A0ABY7CBY1_9BASI|nr:uncharacterized protein PtA15_2A280 [Puccinia triticina]WAQ81967.1 hypothetical protein PtA15_2A280 [Puccinia triticina]WAR52852.1 hypothetical protein PtB15_2B280 [Puccinia triticina]